jgi:hypothetical protein
MLNLLVPQIGLDGPCIHAFVREVIAGGVPQHVRMDREIEFCIFPCPSHQFPYRGRSHWPFAFGGEDIDSAVVTPEPPQGANFSASQGVGTGKSRSWTD